MHYREVEQRAIVRAFLLPLGAGVLMFACTMVWWALPWILTIRPPAIDDPWGFGIWPRVAIDFGAALVGGAYLAAAAAWKVPAELPGFDYRPFKKSLYVVQGLLLAVFLGFVGVALWAIWSKPAVPENYSLVTNVVHAAAPGAAFAASIISMWRLCQVSPQIARMFGVPEK